MLVAPSLVELLWEKKKVCQNPFSLRPKPNSKFVLNGANNDDGEVTYEEDISRDGDDISKCAECSGPINFQKSSHIRFFPFNVEPVTWQRIVLDTAGLCPPQCISSYYLQLLWISGANLPYLVHRMIWMLHPIVSLTKFDCGKLDRVIPFDNRVLAFKSNRLLLNCVEKT